MFSREDVSAFINQHFEPAWEMVRPVPIIRIDFGNGRTATRTLRGNVASYVCGADGNVVDILPGIYTPTAFTTALEMPRDLARDLERFDAADGLARLRDHHRARAQNLRAPAQPARPALAGDVAKVTIEVVVAHVNRRQPTATNRGDTTPSRPRTAAELAGWQPLVEDTRINETQRRLQIHDRLASSERVRPEQLKRWLYRDVLHADLDDPYMGLGGDFFENIESS